MATPGGSRRVDPMLDCSDPTGPVDARLNGAFYSRTHPADALSTINMHMYGPPPGCARSPERPASPCRRAARQSRWISSVPAAAAARTLGWSLPRAGRAQEDQEAHPAPRTVG
ncbi:hypothetical protein WOLCODRAFT_155998 [Wolfiporia cocos MD-104 SS10]|uniref:Uncharacterized protein n=1 Tax=Wolfiporia cocos (strain MD-104) TaxID=742152 RepID=A0A2H3J6B2_WOLCO|nr:hypothetical protein WOLCODRAFT_155998 [Wolfiporia cocos MD-104 SS10]